MDYNFITAYNLQRALVLLCVPIIAFIILNIFKLFFPNSYKKQMEEIEKRDWRKINKEIRFIRLLRILLGALAISFIWLYIYFQK